MRYLYFIFIISVRTSHKHYILIVNYILWETEPVCELFHADKTKKMLKQFVPTKQVWSVPPSNKGKQLWFFFFFFFKFYF